MEPSDSANGTRSSAKLDLRNAPLPLGPRTVGTTVTQNEEQLVQRLYGLDFCFKQDVWTERTVQRLCTGRWYNIIMLAVVERLGTATWASCRKEGTDAGIMVYRGSERYETW
jgi:hypothetical protein